MGAQKAGTTFIYNYLQNQRGVDLRKKEPHFFGYQTLEILARRNPKLLLHQIFPQFYLGDARNFMLKKGVQLTGDLTPRNALMSSNELGRIQRIIDSFQDVELKVIWQMREPVDRIMSAIFMRQRRGMEKITLEDALGIQGYVSRSSYDETGKKISNELRNPAVVFFYEGMPSTSASLDTYLGLEKHPTLLGNWKKSTYLDDLSERSYQNGVRALAKSYEFCFENFPQTRVLWSRAYQLMSSD